MKISALESTTTKYSVIYADPPWSFMTYSDKGKERSADRYYECLSIGDLLNLPISSISDNNCALFMWTTYPMLENALKLMKTWGFKYKTVAFTWVKTNKTNNKYFVGMGYWTRSNVEIVLLGTKGRPKRHDKGVAQVIAEPRREHSRKPEMVAASIERLMGDVPRIELFARQECAGWDCWGNETDKFAP